VLGRKTCPLLRVHLRVAGVKAKLLEGRRGRHNLEPDEHNYEYSCQQSPKP